MLSKTLSYISHHAIAILALVCSLLALAGASYAATQLPKNSVGNAQIQQGAVSPPKFSKPDRRLRADVREDQRGRPARQYSYPQAKLVGWRVSSTAASGGTIYWKPQHAESSAWRSAPRRTTSARASQPTRRCARRRARARTRPHVPVQIAGPAGVSVAVVC